MESTTTAAYVPGPLRIMTIATSGAENDAADVTVKYSGSQEHTTEWIGLRANGGMWRTCKLQFNIPFTNYSSKLYS